MKERRRRKSSKHDPENAVVSLDFCVAPEATSYPRLRIHPFQQTACFDKNRLLVILLLSIVDDVEELELVDTLGGGDNAEPVTQLVLLEELLGATGKAIRISRLRYLTNAMEKQAKKFATYRYLR